MLLNREFSALTERFAQLHTAEAQGLISERQLERAYDGALNYREELTVPLREWAAGAPSFYPAQAALGVHLFGQALKLRTMRRAVDIPEENVERMVGAMMAAQAQLRHAVALDPKASLALISLMFIEMQMGNRAWQLYVEAIQKTPNSMLVRLAMLRNLRTEWGGSEQQQLEFLNRPEHDSLSEEERHELNARQLTQLAHWQLHFAKDAKAAKRTAQASLALVETPYALLALADSSAPLRRVKGLSRALELAPHDLHLQASHASARLESWAPAAPEFARLREAADWGEAYATDLLSVELPLWIWRIRAFILLFVR
ncbi:DUF4034 domain-containing protein (plasmid) [Deinococcus sp. QL22]|nr:DUF4034 domain-containing protein [Deinococcus sp. QL22]